MFYVVHYDRAKAEVLSLNEYADVDMQRALNERATLEAKQSYFDKSQEIVLLQAENREQLCRTHPKYETSETTNKNLAMRIAVSIAAASLGLPFL